MATERQIAANRRNASKSTGPRSRAGKRRASRNSFRHDLSKPAILGTSEQDWVERFAHQATANRDRSVIALELGRSAACAQLDLARVRQVRAAACEHLEASLERSTSQEVSRLDQLIAEYYGQELLVQLRRLDRYERRAAARRDKALRMIAVIGEQC